MIKLTESTEGFDLYVNPAHLIWFKPSKSKKEGSIIFTTAGTRERIVETPGRIMQLIQYYRYGTPAGEEMMW